MCVERDVTEERAGDEDGVSPRRWPQDRDGDAGPSDRLGPSHRTRSVEGQDERRVVLRVEDGRSRHLELRRELSRDEQVAGGVEADNTPDLKMIEVEVKDYDECLACQ